MSIASFGISMPVFAAATIPSAVKPLSRLFYYVPGFATYYSYLDHGNQASIFAPQVYNVDSLGDLTGSITSTALAMPVANKTPIMPLVSNDSFDPDIMHAILGSRDIQNKLIAQLISQAKSNKYSGWQFDFEHIGATYRNQYTAFVQLAATQLHAAHLQLSIAVVARTSDDPADLPAGSWDNWAGVYDYAKLGKYADFITVMAYDQSGSTGPVAALPWVKQVLAYTEQKIPKSKISLGIPTYGWLWNTDTNKMIRSTSYQKVADLLDSKSYTGKGFDTESQTSWITYNQGTGANLVHYKIWYEDATSMQAKLKLAETQKIHGISLWIVGMEDPAIWKIL